MKNDIVPIVRHDGLTIFEDANDPVLNSIRRRGDRRQVVLAVAFRRAQQIALNYAAKYAPDIYAEILRSVDNKMLPVTPGVVAMLPRTAEAAPIGRGKPVELAEAVLVS